MKNSPILTFATPQDIDLYNLFYLGTGAEYAMSEDREYEVVANAFGYDTWLELPTDVNYYGNVEFTSGTTLTIFSIITSFPISLVIEVWG